jgi:hypothetical protein
VVIQLVRVYRWTDREVLIGALAGIRTRLETLKQSVRESCNYLFNGAVSRSVYMTLKVGWQVNNTF